MLEWQEAEKKRGRQTKKIRSVDKRTKGLQQQTERDLSSATLGERSEGDRSTKSTKALFWPTVLQQIYVS